MRSAIYSFSALVLLGGQALAAEPITDGAKAGLSRLTGTVQSVSGNTITIVKDDGAAVEYLVPAGTPLGHGAKSSRTELMTAKYVNCVAADGTKDSLSATRCEIIPPDSKAINMGHRPAGPGMTVTVGKVASISGDPAGKADLELVVAYNDGQQHIAVPVSAQVVKPEPITLSQIKPGDKMIAAVNTVDGKPAIFTLIDLTL